MKNRIVITSVKSKIWMEKNDLLDHFLTSCSVLPDDYKWLKLSGKVSRTSKIERNKAFHLICIHCKGKSGSNYLNFPFDMSFIFLWHALHAHFVVLWAVAIWCFVFFIHSCYISPKNFEVFFLSYNCHYIVKYTKYSWQDFVYKQSNLKSKQIACTALYILIAIIYTWTAK